MQKLSSLLQPGVFFAHEAIGANVVQAAPSVQSSVTSRHGDGALHVHELGSGAELATLAKGILRGTEVVTLPVQPVDTVSGVLSDDGLLAATGGGLQGWTVWRSGQATPIALADSRLGADARVRFLEHGESIALLGPGTYRRWTIEISSAPEGTSCAAIGDPIVTIELYTIFESAPRGIIPLSLYAPPVLFPAAYATVIDGTNTQGMVTISSAATTGIIGTLTGTVTIGNAALALDVTFDAPNCSP